MFCGLSTLSEQKENDNSVDVYMLAKLYHLKRPGIYSKEVNNFALNTKCDIKKN